VGEFEAAWLRRFSLVERFNTPIRLLPRVFNYDVVLLGRPLSP